MNLDKEIFNLIEKENKRQINGVELIASENFVSEQVKQAVGSCLTNKYAEGYPGKRYYGGCEIVDEVETLAIDRAKKLFGVEYVNVQPHSGSQANAAVMLACLNAGDKILGFDLSHGGHLTHGSPVNFSGILYNAIFYGLNKEGNLDYDNIENIARKEKPKMIICGASAYTKDWNYERLRNIADKIGAILLADISHPSGLIASKLLNDPAKFCHIITTTTHKTLRGPRGGMIMIGKDFENPFNQKFKSGKLKSMSTLLNSAVFPGSQGGPLEHVIAGKAVAFKEALDPKFVDYSKQVIANAKTMVSEFIKLDYNVVSGETMNHCMLIDLRSKNINGKTAEDILQVGDITVNKNMVPFDTESPFITSGIRIGTPAITTRGLNENDCKKIVQFIDEILANVNSLDRVNEIKIDVNNYMRKFPMFKV